MGTRHTTRTDTGISNVHQRTVPGDLARSRALLATLATPGDRVWPKDRWPRIWFGDQGPVPGADGGHGPIRYRVVEVTPDRMGFQFTKDLTGDHRLELTEEPDGRVRWTHTINLVRPNLLLRHGIVPLHDACLEDLLDQVEAELSDRPLTRPDFGVGVRLRLALVRG
ncbi:hypothetical protein CGZ94_07220 [Enemella evansiae]|uniref:SRPBCC family protein n=1 Tax=Enemella evansiae TaxID=2016499 RepID=A0A255GN28_9ACTN|nr:hypothetical protein [Enemella evansiae]OYO14394.1 hypothetical protein CGZ94_07220 [Enemella evansiae]